MCRLNYIDIIMFLVLKMLLTNLWRRFKYFIIFLSFLFLIYSIWTGVISHNTVKPKSSINLHYVAVHFDLKGSPPKIKYLVSLLPILSMYGVNAILLEYEDMFPFVDSIANISSVNAYKRTELLMFIYSAKQLKMEIIPLIQTFGHMEYVLKLKEFEHLREVKEHHRDICPSNPESRKLITAMLEQVINLHGIIYPLKHIHVGCDEVQMLNRCPKCKRRKLKPNNLYVDHVKEVSSIVKGISPTVKVLIWGDMFFHQKSGIPQKYYFYNTEAVAWEYAAYPNFSDKWFYNLHKHFNNTWIASAYKGAEEKNATIPNIKKRFLNHLSWMKFILGFKFGGEKRVHNFEGIILTGWSRFKHTDPQCELLPIAMPSLFLNLLLIQTVQKGIDQGDLDLPYCEFFKKHLNKEFSEIFQIHGNSDGKCAFENTGLSVEHDKLFDNTLQFECLRNLDKCESQCRNKSYVDLKKTFEQCERALEKLAERKKSLKTLMIRYYNNRVINSYINDTVEVTAKKIMATMKICTKKSLTNRRN